MSSQLNSLLLFIFCTCLGAFNTLLNVTLSSSSFQVSEIYDQVHQCMIQTPVKDNVPFFWSTMSQIKTNHYRSMAHYFVASALLDHQCKKRFKFLI